MTSSPHTGRSLGTRRAARLVVGLVALVAPLLAATAPASAYWSATGSGSATATTGTLAAPVNVTVPETSIPDVPISWTAGVTDENTEIGYYVTRSQFLVNTEPTFVPVCGSSPSELLAKTATGCTDTGVPDGNYTYRVTAMYRSWTATSQSSPVNVVGPALLAFTSDVADTEPGSTIFPPLTVALQTESGTPYAWAGVQVTITVGPGSPAGVLAGQTAVLTDDEGVATFDTLSIDTAGFGYSLTASNPQLAPATSNSFDVNAPPLLGAASKYSVLATTSIVNNGTGTRIAGDVGVSPEESLSGLSSDMVDGTIHINNDPDAISANLAVSDTFDLLSNMAGGSVDDNLSGLILTAGAYASTGAMFLDGTLILDGQSNPDATFFLKSAGALTTAESSAVILIHVTQASNVFWVVNGGADLGATSTLSGSILASGSITLGAGAELIGRALSQAAVNLDNNSIRFANVLPTIAITRGTSATTADTTPTITGTSTAIPYSRVTVTIPGQSLVTTVRANGTWRVTAGALSAGDHQVIAKVRETNGDTASASQVLSVVSPVNLGSAATFSLLASDSVINFGETTISGDMGYGNVRSGFGPGRVDGAIHNADAAFLGASGAFNDAYNDASSRSSTTDVVGDIGGQTFLSGVHHSVQAMSLSGTVTLDAQEDPDAVFIFQTDGSFTAGTGSEVVLVNGADASNVFWVVASGALIGSRSSFVGTILADGGIDLYAFATLTGRAFSRVSVTLEIATLTGVSPAPAARVAIIPEPTATATDTPAPSPEPSVDQPSATESPTPSATASASPTAEPSATAAPTTDPSPTATDDPSPTPSATPTDQGGTP